MKNPLTNLHEALVYQLEGLYDAEKKLEKAMLICLHKATSQSLKAVIRKYGEQASDKRVKLKRAFSYLGCGHASVERIRDAMVLAAMNDINRLKITDYNTALSFAIELQMDTVSDLLTEVINWEKNAGEELKKIALHQINVRAKGTPTLKTLKL